MSANGHVQIADFSDREILGMMLDAGGTVTSRELAFRIFGWGVIEEKDKVRHGMRCVTSRLAWMRRYGLVEREKPSKENKNDATEWKVSVPAKQMLGAALPKVVEVALVRTSDTAGLALANRVGERLVKAGEITGTAMRRELQFQITRRKRR